VRHRQSNSSARRTERGRCRYCSVAGETMGFALFSTLKRDSNWMFVRFIVALAICAWAANAYSQNSEYSDPEQDIPQPCMPPDTYVAHPGDPPFGVYVQTTVSYKKKTYLLGVQYCEDGTFEFNGHDQGPVSLNGTFYGTGQWWWEGDRSCTQIDDVTPNAELPQGECKEAGHWFGDQKTPASPGASSTRQKHSRLVRQAK
jgi:hypothetical protein